MAGCQHGFQLLLALIFIVSVCTTQVYGQERPRVYIASVFSNKVTLQWKHIGYGGNVTSITSYNIKYGPSSTYSLRSARVRKLSVPNNTARGELLTFTVTGLLPNVNYTFQVISIKRTGYIGHYSARLQATTLASGFVVIQLKLHDVSNCLQWREAGPSSKLNRMRQSIAIEVNKVCPQCQLNDETYESIPKNEIFLRGAFFMCFPKSEHQVTYRTQVLDISTATAQEITDSLQQWMTSSTKENTTIIVDYNRYYVNNCSLIISTFDDSDPECSDLQTPFSAIDHGASSDQSITSTGITVGGVVGVVIAVVFIMAVTGIIVIIALLVFIRTRKSGYINLLSREEPPTITSGENTTSLT